MHVSYTGAEGPNYTISFSSENLPEIDQLYYLLCRVIFVEGIRAAPRGMPIKEILNCSFHLENPRSRVITSARRAVKPKYLAGELVWYLSGEREIGRIIKHSTFWKNLVDEHGKVNSNYGDKIFWSGGEFLPANSQFVKVANELVRDPDSRRAVISIHTQEAADQNPKDVPCTLNLQFFIRDSKLHLSTMMRSNDLMLGFCNDLFQFTMIQELMLSYLHEIGYEKFDNLELGTYHHYAGSMHVYERHFELLKEEVLGDAIICHELTAFAAVPPLQPMDKISIREFKDALCLFESGSHMELIEALDSSKPTAVHLAKMMTKTAAQDP